MKLNYLEGRHISLSWFSCGSSILVELKFGDVGFCEGRKTGKPGEKPAEKLTTNNKRNPCMAPGRNRPQATLAGSERSHQPRRSCWIIIQWKKYHTWTNNQRAALYEWSSTLIVLILCKEEPHQINGYGEFFSNLKRDAFVRTIRGDNKTTPKPPERTLGVLKYGPRRTERN